MGLGAQGSGGAPRPGPGRCHGFLAPAPWPLLGRTTTWPTRYDSAGVALTHTCHHHSPLSSVCQWHTCTADQAVGAREGAHRGALSPLWVFVCGWVYAFGSLVLAPASCLLVCTWSQSPRGPSSALAARSRAPATVWLTVWRAVPPCGVCSPPRSRDGVLATYAFVQFSSNGVRRLDSQRHGRPPGLGASAAPPPRGGRGESESRVSPGAQGAAPLKSTF